MIWLDSDVLCSQTWDKDTLEAIVHQDLILTWRRLYGTTRGEEFRTKMLNTYSEDLCSTSLLDDHMSVLRNCTGEKSMLIKFSFSSILPILMCIERICVRRF